MHWNKNVIVRFSTLSSTAITVKFGEYRLLLYILTLRLIPSTKFNFNVISYGILPTCQDGLQNLKVYFKYENI